MGNDENLRIVIHDVIPIERGKDGKTRRPGRLKRWWHRRKRNSSVSISPEAMDDAVDNVFEEILEFLLGLIFGG